MTGEKEHIQQLEWRSFLKQGTFGGSVLNVSPLSSVGNQHHPVSSARHKRVNTWVRPYDKHDAMKNISTLILLLLCLAAASPVAALAQEADDPILVIDPQGHSAMINEVIFTPNSIVLAVGECLYV